MRDADFTLDTLGLFCPLPVILTSKKMKGMDENQILEILSDDEGIKNDMPIWCRESGNELLDFYQEGPLVKLYIRRKM